MTLPSHLLESFNQQARFALINIIYEVPSFNTHDMIMSFVIHSIQIMQLIAKVPLVVYCTCTGKKCKSSIKIGIETFRCQAYCRL